MDQNTQTPPGANQGGQQAGGQSAQADLQAVANRAKAAAEGFQFNKLFEGRIGNMHFLYFFVASIILGFVLGMIPVIGWIISLALAVLGVGVGIRRFHDIGVTGWAVLVFFIPIVGLLVALYLCWKHGDAGANAYGAAPDSKREFFRAVLNT